MTTGLRLPVGVDGTGGAARVSADENDSKIIRIALGDCDSEHAYQQEAGLGSGMVFDTNDPNAKARSLAKIRSIFRRFQDLNRFKLLPDTVRWERDTEGELTLSFRYKSLESDEEYPFRQTLRSALEEG